MSQKVSIAPSALLSLVLLACVPPLWPQTPDRIMSTDITGTKGRLSEPITFKFDDQHQYLEDYPGGGFEVVLSESPRTIARVDYSQIRLAAFEHGKDRLKLSMTLDDGSLISGDFPDRSLKVSGNGELKEVTFEVQKLKSIEFLQFSLRDDKVVDRQAALVEWQKSRAKINKEVYGREEGRVWTILDGQTTINAHGFDIWDRFDTNSNGVFTYSGRRFRRQDYLGSDFTGNHITVERGTSQVKLPIEDVKSIEFTGRQINGKPEVNLVKKDGGQFTVLFMLLKDGIQFGAPDEDDMLVWEMPYGYRGLSFLPIRKILIEAGPWRSGLSSLHAGPLAGTDP